MTNPQNETKTGCIAGVINDWAQQYITQLNRDCFCMRLDKQALKAALKDELSSPDLFELLEAKCPYIFAAQPVFVSQSHIQQMQALVAAVTSVVEMPAYQAMVLANAPAEAQHQVAAKGVFFGYDFHLHEQGIALIEINTNAGGAMMNALLARAQHACCKAVELVFPHLDSETFETAIIDMLHAEWAASGQAGRLKVVAIVDTQPQTQYLYPEFLLFQQCFARHGIQTLIVDPSDLVYQQGGLFVGPLRIDLVYNRLTDFMLTSPESKALHDAYRARVVTVTPHPRAHALYANKRNLAILSDPQRLCELGVAPAIQSVLLSAIPRTELVNSDHAARLWAERRHLFFKPASGFGSRAAYRGDKLTKRVWDDIVSGDYVAQTLVAPATRMIGVDQSADKMKFDLRAYAYDGHIQWLAARLYQGQTTNFRTQGGGFAPVYRMHLP